MSTTTTETRRKPLPMPTAREVRERLAENLAENQRLRQLLKCLPSDEQEEASK